MVKHLLIMRLAVLMIRLVIMMIMLPLMTSLAGQQMRAASVLMVRVPWLIVPELAMAP